MAPALIVGNKSTIEAVWKPNSVAIDIDVARLIEKRRRPELSVELCVYVCVSVSIFGEVHRSHVESQRTHFIRLVASVQSSEIYTICDYQHAYVEFQSICYTFY